MNKLIHFYMVSIFLIFFLNLAHAEEKKQFFGYEGAAGPADWDDLAELLKIDPYFCREGKHQSPIDLKNIPELNVPYPKLKNLAIDYSSTPIGIINNGHTIHLSYDSGSKVKWENKTFELIQFHFHSPSEHTINQRQYDMEMHLVHKSQDQKFLVLGILMKMGKHNSHIQKIWDRIPSIQNKEVVYQDDLFNVEELLPSKKEFFYYSGSLTTPPCLENVNWFIMKTVIEVSSDQILFFKNFINNNARPTQKLNNRLIKNVRPQQLNKAD